jgi:uncharacterized metal-binding protein
MKNPENKQQKILIITCNGDSAAGKVAWLASQELVLEGKAEWCLSWQQIEETLVPNGNESTSFIIVEGCENKCLFNELLEEGLVGKHHLVLSDVGIDPVYLEDISREEIELAKEAIISECKPINKTIPPLFSGCCCG